jgi:hypothetical protein
MDVEQRRTQPPVIPKLVLPPPPAACESAPLFFFDVQSVPDVCAACPSSLAALIETVDKHAKAAHKAVLWGGHALGMILYSSNVPSWFNAWLGDATTLLCRNMSCARFFSLVSDLVGPGHKEEIFLLSAKLDALLHSSDVLAVHVWKASGARVSLEYSRHVAESRSAAALAAVAASVDMFDRDQELKNGVSAMHALCAGDIDGAATHLRVDKRVAHLLLDDANPRGMAQRALPQPLMESKSASSLLRHGGSATLRFLSASSSSSRLNLVSTFQDARYRYAAAFLRRTLINKLLERYGQVGLDGPHDRSVCLVLLNSNEGAHRTALASKARYLYDLYNAELMVDAYGSVPLALASCCATDEPPLSAEQVDASLAMHEMQKNSGTKFSTDSAEPVYYETNIPADTSWFTDRYEQEAANVSALVSHATRICIGYGGSGADRFPDALLSVALPHVIEVRYARYPTALPLTSFVSQYACLCTTPRTGRDAAEEICDVAGLDHDTAPVGSRVVLLTAAAHDKLETMRRAAESAPNSQLEEYRRRAAAGAERLLNAFPEENAWMMVYESRVARTAALTQVARASPARGLHYHRDSEQRLHALLVAVMRSSTLTTPAERSRVRTSTVVALRLLRSRGWADVAVVNVACDDMANAPSVGAETKMRLLFAFAEFALLACFGVPAAHRHDCEVVLRAALLGALRLYCKIKSAAFAEQLHDLSMSRKRAPIETSVLEEALKVHCSSEYYDTVAVAQLVCDVFSRYAAVALAEHIQGRVLEVERILQLGQLLATLDGERLCEPLHTVVQLATAARMRTTARITAAMLPPDYAALERKMLSEKREDVSLDDVRFDTVVISAGALAHPTDRMGVLLGTLLKCDVPRSAMQTL